VLAIDTALAACSVALLDTDSGRILASQSLPMVRGHAEALMPLVEQVMNEAGVEFSDINRVAVTTGPGSFTGLRVGIAAARGIALAAEKPAVGLSTLSAYAAPYLARAGRATDAIPIVAAIDARHQHVYLQVFSAGSHTFAAPRLASLEEAAQAAAETPCRLVGSAAQTVAAALSPSDAQPISVDARPAPDIAWVARMGAAVVENESPPTPQYLHAPDAQPQYAAQLPRR
jgi:tRNA threonylcarbamoyladenosine biosynthesis protein TsaB